MCVDPFPLDFESPAANRTCSVVRAAVSGAGRARVQFVRPENGALGGILQTLGAHREEALSNNGGGGGGGVVHEAKVVTLRTLGIRDLLAGRTSALGSGEYDLKTSRNGSNGGGSGSDGRLGVSIPRHIDYLSLDVEGQEAEILEAWPFEAHSIGLVTVEHNYEEPKRRRIRDVLERNGFLFVFHVDVDDWYQNAKLYPVKKGTANE